MYSFKNMKNGPSVRAAKLAFVLPVTFYLSRHTLRVFPSQHTRSLPDLNLPAFLPICFITLRFAHIRSIILLFLRAENASLQKLKSTKGFLIALLFFSLCLFT